jgi:arylsulfatase A-like enzyme
MAAMVRRLSIACIAAALVLGCGSRPSARARHLLLVTIDTLRADHLSCYGYARATSDAAHAAQRGSVAGFTIDDIASRGVRFGHAFSPRGMTFPAIATLFTGRSPIETCALENGNVLPASADTLAEFLHAQGFKCAAFTSNKLLVVGSGIEQGFDEFFSDASDDKDSRAVDAACAWLKEQDLENGPRLFVWLHLTGPHLPYDPAPIGGVDFARMFADPSYEGPANGSRAFVDGVHTSQTDLAPSDVAAIVALYDGEVARVDHLTSRFLAFCAGRDPKQPIDVLSHSLLVLTADHGEELFERNRYFGHSKSVYDDVLHVPLVWLEPGRDGRAKPARVVDDLIGLQDVSASVIDALGIPVPPASHDKSFARILDGEMPYTARREFSLWRDRIFSVRSDRWRLVWNPDRVEPKETPPGAYPVPEIALFDVAADPHELHEVSAAHADVVRDFQNATRAWLESLHPCASTTQGITPERLKALRDMGYAGEEDDQKSGAKH